MHFSPACGKLRAIEREVRIMNCPLCDTPLDETLTCPNCGTCLEIPTLVTAPEEIPDTGHPGIFYENLISSQQIYEEEHRSPKPPRYTPVEKIIMLGASLLLLCLMVLVNYGSLQYDPNAPALRGRGITMDNREFSIYYQSAYQSFLAQYSENLPFDQNRSLKKQYYNLSEGYTWEDYFISQAYPNAALTEKLVCAARETGFSLDEGSRSSLEATRDSLRSYTESRGSTPEAYLQSMYGPHMTEDAYYAYLEDTFLAQAYTEYLYSEQIFSDAEIEDYYSRHRADYEELEQARDAVVSDMRTEALQATVTELLNDIPCKLTRFAAAPE